jgi:hypothetical protein
MSRFGGVRHMFIASTNFLVVWMRLLTIASLFFVLHRWIMGAPAKLITAQQPSSFSRIWSIDPPSSLLPKGNTL